MFVSSFHQLLFGLRFDCLPTKQAGDYGKVDKKTGEFMYEGNIYTDADIMQIANQYPCVPGAEVDKYRVHSLEVEGLSIEVAAKLYVSNS